MSQYNVKLCRRVEEVVVKEILKIDPNGAAGLPYMEITDQEHRLHRLTAVDFQSFDWVKIKEGTVILVSISEHIDGAEVML